MDDTSTNIKNNREMTIIICTVTDCGKVKELFLSSFIYFVELSGTDA